MYYDLAGRGGIGRWTKDVITACMSINAAGNRPVKRIAVLPGSRKREKNDPARHAAVNACPQGPIVSILGILIGHRLTLEKEQYDYLRAVLGDAETKRNQPV